METVDRTVIVKLPKEFDDLLRMIANAQGETPEQILLEELYGVLYNFYEGNYLDDHYLVSLGKHLDKQCHDVAVAIGAIDC
jgi:hypothetical protein